MRVLWTHNFDPEKPNSQVFMNIAAGSVRALGVDLQCEYLGNLRSVKNLRRARAHVAEIAGEFDLIHAQYGSACGLASTAANGLPSVLSIRGNDWNVHSADFGFHFFHTRLARLMTRWSLNDYDAVVTVSRRVAADVRPRFKGEIHALPSPVDLGRFVPRNKREAREQLGFPDCDEKWVLFNAINLDDPIKRFHLAKEAFDLANEKCGNLRLRLATGLEHAEIPLFTAACDVILCTSETEGWPNCVKEALACNVPFVSTDVSDLLDIATVEPSCRVCPEDPSSLADNICEVVALDGPTDLRRFVEPMGLESFGQQLVGLYESLLSRSGRSASTMGGH